MSLHQARLPSLRDKLRGLAEEEAKKQEEVKEEVVVEKVKKGRRLSK